MIPLLFPELIKDISFDVRADWIERVSERASGWACMQARKEEEIASVHSVCSITQGPPFDHR